MRSVVLKALKLLAFPVLLVGGLLAYNYARHLVYWSPTESVSFESADGVRLSGTLIKPSDEGVFPAVVVLHGSGPDSVDGLSYRLMANAILRSGLAVLLYDKRGVGDSGGDFETALYRDFVADGVAAVDYLARRNDIDAAAIGLLGLSEGGWFTPEIAHTTGKVAFIFNRVASPLPWRDHVIWEVRNDLIAAGVSEEDLTPLLDVTMRQWNFYVDVAADPNLAEGPTREAINAESKRLIAEIPVAESQVYDELLPYDPEMYERYAADISYDPRPHLEAIDVPMIYTFGETDINAPTAQAVAFLEEFTEQHGKDIDFVVFEGVGHSMATWKGLLTAGFTPGFVELLQTWFREQVAD